MNRAFASMLALAILALPLFAEEAKKSETQKPKTTTAAPAQPASQDSPLVAAAKRSNRLGKKPASKILITNETLKSSGTTAHVTTPAQLTELNMPRTAVKPTPEMVAAQQAAGQRKLAEEATAKRRAEAAEQKHKLHAEVRTVEEQSGEREGMENLPEDYQGRPEDFEEPPPDGDQPAPPPPPPPLR